MIKILFVIPYLALKKTFDNAIAAYPLEGVEVTLTHLYGSDPKIIEGLDADIIVARGITATAIIKQKPDTHVVPIVPSSSDLIAALAKAKELDRSAHVGIVSSEHLVDESTISSLIEQQISVAFALDQHDVAVAIEELKAKGCTIFVGGLTLCRICEEQGLRSVHVKSGVQAIIHAIEEAMATARSLQRAQMRANLLTTLLNNASEALLAVDRGGVIISGNRKAHEIFATASLEGVAVASIPTAPWWQEVEGGEEFVSINSKPYLVTRQPIDLNDRSLGCLYTFQDGEAISKSEHKIRTELKGKGLIARYSFDDIVTQDNRMLSLVEKAKRFAQVSGAVLLLGETGTGKELFAQSIHNASPRAHEPFVAINCAALPEQLLESELFGYTDGAFTGAVKGGKVGLFELAHKGTLFLDEIVEMPITVQAKLLRVLQEKEVRKIGADMVIPVDVRIISAANNTILENVRTASFRLDLFYRISLLSLTLIPLADRKGDLGILFSHFVRQYCHRHKIPKPKITNEAIEALHEFSWPGNIRELRNAAERLAILHTGDTVNAGDIEELDISATGLHTKTVQPMVRRNARTCSDEELYEEFLVSGLSRELFAKRVGLSRTTLWRRFSNVEQGSVER